MSTAIVIDNDYDTVTSFSDYLELMQVQVVGKGYDGKEAVELYQKLRPDIIFLDVMMPLYDGFYALEKIRQTNPAAVVIMVTEDLTSDTEDRSRKLKASAIVYKPYDINKIMGIVHGAVSTQIQASIMQQGQVTSR